VRGLGAPRAPKSPPGGRSPPRPGPRLHGARRRCAALPRRMTQAPRPATGFPYSIKAVAANSSRVPKSMKISRIKDAVRIFSCRIVPTRSSGAGNPTIGVSRYRGERHTDSAGWSVCPMMRQAGKSFFPGRVPGEFLSLLRPGSCDRPNKRPFACLTGVGVILLRKCARRPLATRLIQPN